MVHVATPLMMLQMPKPEVLPVMVANPRAHLTVVVSVEARSKDGNRARDREVVR